MKQINHLFDAESLKKALVASGKVFRDRVIPTSDYLIIFMAAIIKGDEGLWQLFQWLGFHQHYLNVTEQALYKARNRIGHLPLRWIYDNCLKWRANPEQELEAFCKGMRLIGLDGTTLTTPDTDETASYFGRSNNQFRPSAFPLVRLVVLCELGTRCIVRWIYTQLCTSELSTAIKLLEQVPAKSLVIADRLLYAWKMWKKAQEHAVFMLIRVQSGPKFRVLEVNTVGACLLV